MKDKVVEQPEHYTKGNIEAIEYMRDNMSPEAFKGFLEGSVKKYLHRWTYKSKPEEDLKKARWYLNELIRVLEMEKVVE